MSFKLSNVAKAEKSINVRENDKVGEWKRNKRIYRKMHSFDCEPAPGDIPEYNQVSAR